MFRPVAALILSAALALPGTQARAEFDRRQAAQILGGLAALYVLKEAIDRRDDARDARPAPVQRHRVHRPHRPQHQVHRPHRPRHQAHRPHRHGDHRLAPGWPHGNARIIPARCAQTFESRHGAGLGYDARCMWNNVPRPGLLPDVCLRQVRTHRGWQQFYPRACLYRAGWQVAARRH